MTAPTVFIHYCDEAVWESTRFLLESYGWVVRTIASPRELLELPASVWGCLVLGSGPSVSGALVLVESLRQRGVSLPAVLTAAPRDEAQLRRARQARAEFADPHTEGAVVDAVRRAIDASGPPTRDWSGSDGFRD